MKTISKREPKKKRVPRHYLGRTHHGEYELGKSAEFWDSGAGFPWTFFLCSLHPKLVAMMGVTLAPGEVREVTGFSARLTAKEEK